VSLKQRIENDLKAALLGGDRFKGEVLRGLKAAILNEEVAQKVREEGLSDDAIEQLIGREIKKRNDSATQFAAADRPELSETELKEAAILVEYQPEQVSEADIQAFVTKTIADLGVANMAGMGQVIGATKKEFGNTADGSLIAQLVKNALQ
jgi:uncharacterized protein YqeY